MRWICIAACLAWLSCLAAEDRESVPPPSLSRDQLRAELATFITQPRFASAAWGIQAQSLRSGEIIFQTNANKLLKPASTAKLFTAALALDQFGPDYRIRTSALAAEPPSSDGIVEGDLVIYGRGDPSISARFRGGDYTGLLRPLAHAITNAGVRLVHGRLVGDETYFTGPPHGASWTWDDLQYYYGAPSSALTVQDNVIDIMFRPGIEPAQPCDFTTRPELVLMQFINRTATGPAGTYPATRVHRPLGQAVAYLEGSVPLGHPGHADSVSVPYPALWFITLLENELRQCGVEIQGGLETRAWPEHAPTRSTNLHEIASTESAPMSELAASMLRHSQNLYAQLLLLHAGAAEQGSGWTEQLGMRRLQAFASKLGIPESDLLLDEGSGLSRASLLTPAALVRLLRAMHEHPRGQVFRACLPAGGDPGTLRNRLNSPALRGKVRAKTGSIRYVTTLAGYLDTQAGEPLAFAFLLNAYQPPSGHSPRADLDALVELLARLEPGSEPKAAD